SPPTRAFTVDTAFIDTTLESGPDGVTSDTTPSFTFSTTTTGATYECKLESPDSPVPTFAACSSPFTSPTLHSDAFTLKVRAKAPDGHTNSTPAKRGFTVDADTPNTTITQSPTDSGETPDTEPQFAFASSEPNSTFE